jgi:hypothetical protein
MSVDRGLDVSGPRVGIVRGRSAINLSTRTCPWTVRVR